MKKNIFLTLLFSISVNCVFAQSSVIGSKAEKIEGVEWLSDEPTLKGRAMLMEFFHSSNANSVKRIDLCNQTAKDYYGRLNVVIMTREPAEQISKLLLKEYQYSYVGVDDKGDIFNKYGVFYVPYAVIVDKKGIIRWTGNPRLLTYEIIDKIVD